MQATRLQVIAEQWTERSGAEEKGFILPIAVTSAVCVALADVSKLGCVWGGEGVGGRVVMLAEMRMDVKNGWARVEWGTVWYSASSSCAMYG